MDLDQKPSAITVRRRTSLERRSSIGAADDDLDYDDDEAADLQESDQPCDLRLSSHFKLELVSMALKQAAAAATADQQSAAAAMAAAMITGGAPSAAGTAGMSAAAAGMPPATQLQHAALQSIAAVATSHQTPVHSLHHTSAHHALMNFPCIGSGSPSRRYSTSSSIGGGGGGGGAGPSGSLTPGSVSNPNASLAGGAISTSCAIAPHTPSSSSSAGGIGSSLIGGAQGMSGAGGAGATGASSGTSGPMGSGSSTSWGGAYTCERCGNSYARPHSLNRHVRFECGVEPKFECPICHKKSKHKHNLVLHMRTHQHR